MNLQQTDAGAHRRSGRAVDGPDGAALCWAETNPSRSRTRRISSLLAITFPGGNLICERPRMLLNSSHPSSTSGMARRCPRRPWNRPSSCAQLSRGWLVPSACWSSAVSTMNAKSHESSISINLSWVLLPAGLSRLNSSGSNPSQSRRKSRRSVQTRDRPCPMKTRLFRGACTGHNMGRDEVDLRQYVPPCNLMCSAGNDSAPRHFTSPKHVARPAPGGRLLPAWP